MRCLSLLYEDDNVLAPPFFIQFDIESAFDMMLAGSVFTFAQNSDILDYYFFMTSVRYLWRNDTTEYQGDLMDAVEYGRRLIEYVLTLHSGLSEWPRVEAEVKRDMYRGGSWAEQFRKITSFLRSL